MVRNRLLVVCPLHRQERGVTLPELFAGRPPRVPETDRSVGKNRGDGKDEKGVVSGSVVGS